MTNYSGRQRSLAKAIRGKADEVWDLAKAWRRTAPDQYFPEDEYSEGLKQISSKLHALANQLEAM